MSDRVSDDTEVHLNTLSNCDPFKILRKNQTKLSFLSFSVLIQITLRLFLYYDKFLYKIHDRERLCA